MKVYVILILTISNFYAFGQTADTLYTNSKTNPNKQLNVITLGYQIGGITYLGAEYEYRFSKHIGLNTGAGITGYTGGFKFHFCPCRTGPFLSLSFKDSGFGKLGTINAELGGVLFFFDKMEKMGISCQIGAGQIIYLSEKYNPSKNLQLHQIAFSFGIGFSYYLN